MAIFVSSPTTHTFITYEVIQGAPTVRDSNHTPCKCQKTLRQNYDTELLNFSVISNTQVDMFYWLILTNRTLTGPLQRLSLENGCAQGGREQ